MPVTEAAALLTNGYRARLIDLRDTTGLATAALLSGVDLDLPPARLASSLAAWRIRAGRVIGGAQERSAQLSATYLRTYLSASGVDAGLDDLEPEVPRSDPLTVVTGALLWRLGQRAGRASAAYTAGAVAQRVARSAVHEAATSTLARGIVESPTVRGWRRVTSSSCCSRCADAASGGVRSDRDRFSAVHPADRCTQEPVVAGLTERWVRASAQVVAP